MRPFAQEAPMRARNLKPGLFKNEELGTAEPLYTVIFEGLWTLADREGRLEDRPLRIHAEVNPYRPSAGTMQALDWLCARRFIVRYRVGGVALIWIPAFLDHQNPHIREPASILPPPENADKEQEDVSAPEQHSAGTVPDTHQHQSGPADSGFRIPDSPFLIPDCADPVQSTDRRRPRRGAPRETDVTDGDWSRFQEAYPERAGEYRWSKARIHLNAALAEGDEIAAVLDGVRRYAANMAAVGWIGTEKVKRAETFCSQRSWRESWTLPKVNGHGQRPKVEREPTPAEIAAARAKAAADNARTAEKLGLTSFGK
jgi:hypothetical protein